MFLIIINVKNTCAAIFCGKRDTFVRILWWM